MNIKDNKRIVGRLAAALFLAVFALFSVFPAPARAAVTNQSIAVPMYEYPTIGTFWDDITGAGGGTVPFVIVNPASGPGVAADPIYTSEIAENTTDGIRSIGYVYSSYQTRNWQEVYDDIDDWYQLYPGISGIFIDLVEDNTAAELCYIAGLYNHVKNVHPNDLVILNPGTNINPTYEPYGDIFMNAENTLSVYQSSWSIMYPGWEDNPANQNRFWHAIHTADPVDYTTALNLTRANNAGWVYITDDVMPNPYKVTPTYWSTEVSDVDALPDTVIPNRGKTQLPSGCMDLTAATANTTTVAAEQVTTTSAIEVTNTSATYNVEPATSVDFTLPSGVTFAGTGTGWTCNSTTGECDYGSTINASQTAEVLSASFTASCDYSSGDVNGVLSNFAGNTFSFAVTPTRPADCAVAGAATGELANTGNPTGMITIGAIAFTAVAARIYFSRTRVRYVYATLRRRR